jgi:hypothetical protein
MHLQKLIKQVIFTLFALTVVTYTGYKLVPLLSGPKIIISSTDSKESAGLIIVRGQAIRTKELKIFDKIIEMNDKGEFVDTVIRHDPYTTVIISAKDRWGKNDTVQLLVN